mgnify:CR=1 FL=1
MNDAAASTSKRLEKQRLLGEYFRAIEDDADLRRAVRYAGGRIFPATDECVLGVSGAIMSAATLPQVNVSPQVYHDTAVASGEIGEALAKLWPQPLGGSPTHLTLAEMAEAFDDLAATGAQDAKRRIVADLFARCGRPRDAAYLAKIIFGDLRTGVQEGVL